MDDRFKYFKNRQADTKPSVPEELELPLARFEVLYGITVARDAPGLIATKERFEALKKCKVKKIVVYEKTVKLWFQKVP